MTTTSSRPNQTTGAKPSTWSTHEVFNQPPPLTGYNVYMADAALVEGVARWDAAWA